MKTYTDVVRCLKIKGFKNQNFLNKGKSKMKCAFPLTRTWVEWSGKQQ